MCTRSALHRLHRPVGYVARVDHQLSTDPLPAASYAVGWSWGGITGELTVAGVLKVVYGVIAYVASLASSIYAVMWLGNMGVPKTIDSGTRGDPLESAIVDVVLLGAFALQHSIMARPAFKRWWERYVPRQIERSTYVLATSVLLAVICLAWRPLPQQIWA